MGAAPGDALVSSAEVLPAERAPEAREALDALQEAPLLLTCDARGRVVLAEGEALRVPPRSLVGRPASALGGVLPWLQEHAPRALRGEPFTQVVEELAGDGRRRRRGCWSCAFARAMTRAARARASSWWARTSPGASAASRSWRRTRRASASAAGADAGGAVDHG